MFDQEEEIDTLFKCIEIINRGFRPGKLEDDLFFLFASKRKFIMPLREMMLCGSRVLLSDYSKNLEKYIME